MIALKCASFEVKKSAPWEWLDGFRLGRGTIEANLPDRPQTSVLMNYLPCNYGDSITVHWGDSDMRSYSFTNEYDADENYRTYWENSGAGTRTFNIFDRNTKFIRVTIQTEFKDTAYVLNNTTGEYLYKGKDVS